MRFFLFCICSPAPRNSPNIFRRTCGVGMKRERNVGQSSFSHFSGLLHSHFDPSRIPSSAVNTTNAVIIIDCRNYANNVKIVMYGK